MTDLLSTLSSKLSITYISPGDLKFNPWNSNKVDQENMGKLDKSLKDFGQFQPIIARRLPDQTIQVLGGEHRTKIAIKNDIAEVPCIILENISDDKAKKMSLILNARYGKDDNEKLMELLKTVENSDLLPEIMPFDDDQFKALLAITEVDQELLDMGNDDNYDDEEEPSQPLEQIIKFKVSIEDAAFIETVLLKTARKMSFKHKDIMGNQGDALVYLLRKTEK